MFNPCSTPAAPVRTWGTRPGVGCVGELMIRSGMGCRFPQRLFRLSYKPRPLVGFVVDLMIRSGTGCRFPQRLFRLSYKPRPLVGFVVDLMIRSGTGCRFPQRLFRLSYKPHTLDGCPMFAPAQLGCTWVEHDRAKPLLNPFVKEMKNGLVVDLMIRSGMGCKYPQRLFRLPPKPTSWTGAPCSHRRSRGVRGLNMIGRSPSFILSMSDSA